MAERTLEVEIENVQVDLQVLPDKHVAFIWSIVNRTVVMRNTALKLQPDICYHLTDPEKFKHP
jgi:hypothetical protein